MVSDCKVVSMISQATMVSHNVRRSSHGGSRSAKRLASERVKSSSTRRASSTINSLDIPSVVAKILDIRMASVK